MRSRRSASEPSAGERGLREREDVRGLREREDERGLRERVSDRLLAALIR